MFKFILIISFAVCAVNCDNSEENNENALSNNEAAFVDNDSCGIMNNAEIKSGELSSRDQFPWSAILSMDFQDDGEFSTSGTAVLISSKHLLANVQGTSYVDEENNYIAVGPERLKVFLGTTKYDDLSEEGSLKLDVSQITNHPKAKKIPEPLMDMYQIAIITLEQEVTFTQYIKPICLWTFETESLIGRQAFSEGYGDDYKEQRKHLGLTVIECEDNFEKEINAAKEIQQFCAIGGGEEPCYGDDLLYIRVSTKWYLKGIQNTFESFENDTCNVQKPTLYEDITPYVQWIQSEIN